jgi:hypothetical protein
VLDMYVQLSAAIFIPTFSFAFAFMIRSFVSVIMLAITYLISLSTLSLSFYSLSLSFYSLSLSLSLPRPPLLRYVWLARHYPAHFYQLDAALEQKTTVALMIQVRPSTVVL